MNKNQSRELERQIDEALADLILEGRIEVFVNEKRERIFRLLPQSK